jgi:hypothetical protein
MVFVEQTHVFCEVVAEFQAPKIPPRGVRCGSSCSSLQQQISLLVGDARPHSRQAKCYCVGRDALLSLRKGHGALLRSSLPQ